MEDALLKRNFYLMLSVLEGQSLAASVGFTSPSEEIQQSELLEVIKKWLILAGFGFTDIIAQCAKWVVALSDDEFDQEQQEATQDSLISFGVALIAILLDKNFIEFSERLEISEESSAQFLRELIGSVIEESDE